MPEDKKSTQDLDKVIDSDHQDKVGLGCFVLFYMKLERICVALNYLAWMLFFAPL